MFYNLWLKLIVLLLKFVVSNLIFLVLFDGILIFDKIICGVLEEFGFVFWMGWSLICFFVDKKGSLKYFRLCVFLWDLFVFLVEWFEEELVFFEWILILIFLVFIVLFFGNL